MSLPDLRPSHHPNGPDLTRHLGYLHDAWQRQYDFSPIPRATLEWIALSENKQLIWSPYPNFDPHALAPQSWPNLLQSDQDNIPSHTPGTSLPLTDVLPLSTTHDYAVQIAQSDGSVPYPILYRRHPTRSKVTPHFEPMADLNASFAQTTHPIAEALNFPVSLTVERPRRGRWTTDRSGGGGWDGLPAHMHNRFLDEAINKAPLTDLSGTHWSTLTSFIGDLVNAVAVFDNTQVAGHTAEIFAQAQISPQTQISQIPFEPLFLLEENLYDLNFLVIAICGPQLDAEITQAWQLHSDSHVLHTGQTAANGYSRLWWTPDVPSLGSVYQTIYARHQTPSLLSALQSTRARWEETVSGLESAIIQELEPLTVACEYFALSLLVQQYASLCGQLSSPLLPDQV